MLVFIIGVGRSGTSLLQSMLNSHSKIFFLKENQILRNILNGNINKNLSGELLFKEIVSKSNFDRLNLSIENIDLASPKKAYDSLIKFHIKSDKISFIGDKDPRNLDYVEKIQLLYPKSKVIMMTRDPRAVCASRLKAKWSKRHRFIFHPLIYFAQLSLFYKKDNKKILKISYENLIKNPKKQINIMLDWLNLDYEPECLEFHESAKKLISDDEFSWKKETLQPITMSYADKWKNELTKSQIKIIEAINYKYIHKLNLSLLFNRPNFFVLLFYSFLSNLFLLVYKLFRQ